LRTEGGTLIYQWCEEWSERSRQPTHEGTVVPPATGAHGRKASQSPGGVTQRATRSEPAQLHQRMLTTVAEDGGPCNRA